MLTHLAHPTSYSELHFEFETATDVYYVSTIQHPDVLKQINRFMKVEKAMIEKLKLKHGVQDVK